MKFGSPLSKELRQKHLVKTVRPVKGDSVRILKGGFKGIEGKISSVDPHVGKIYVEGVSREKIAGGKTGAVPIDASKVMVTVLNLEDDVRRERLENKTKAAEKRKEEA